MLTLTEHRRLWAKVDASQGGSACWTWSASKNRWGYPQFSVGGRQTNASRYVLAEKLGRDMLPGEQALHSCDNPGCMNPSHLRAGSSADNMRDKTIRGRHRSPKGAAHGHAIISEKDAVEIRRRRAAGEMLKSIAAAFGVSKQLVCDISKGRRWSHVA